MFAGNTTLSKLEQCIKASLPKVVSFELNITDNIPVQAKNASIPTAVTSSPITVLKD